ncbi:MAG: hypothetical protein ACOYOK_00670 [Pseudobdellovibrionaceae bacterium]
MFKSNDLWPSHNQRSLSEFVSNELLYDYAIGALDEHRKNNLEECLKNNITLQAELNQLQKSIDYLNELKNIQINSKIIQSIDDQSNYWLVFAQRIKLNSWPVGLRWGAEALLVLSLMVIVIVFSPWNKIFETNWMVKNSDIILAEIIKSEKNMNSKDSTPAEFKDEIKSEIKSEQIAKNEVTIKTDESNKFLDVPITKNEKNQQTEQNNLESSNQSEGYLFRGTIKITNLDTSTTKIKEFIESLGGRKAGEVNLGWKKNPGSAYFHFTLPEAKKKDLEDFLLQFGQLKLAKEKHPRIMPGGIIRLIVTVEEASP